MQTRKTWNRVFMLRFDQSMIKDTKNDRKQLLMTFMDTVVNWKSQEYQFMSIIYQYQMCQLMRCCQGLYKLMKWANQAPQNSAICHKLTIYYNAAVSLLITLQIRSGLKYITH